MNYIRNILKDNNLFTFPFQSQVHRKAPLIVSYPSSEKLLSAYGGRTGGKRKRKASKITGRDGACGKYCGTAPSSAKISFTNFRQSFTSNVNYLKRRFSSGDLSSEVDDESSSNTGLASVGRQDSAQTYQGVPERPLQSQPQPMAAPSHPVPGAPPPGSDLSLILRPGSKTTSAPSSPAKTRESLLQRVQSLTGAARDQGASILGAAVSGATRGQGFGSKDRFFTLLVIDDQNTDWSKYFRCRRIHGDYEVRVEQAEFRQLSLTANEAGTIVSMAVYRNGTKVIRSFKPDFVLIRQNLRDANEDYKNLLLGFMYGGIPSVNSLQAIYNFQDKPWVFAHLLDMQRRLGKNGFQMIEQTYYPDHREMVSAPGYPLIVKLGHAHSGVGKARANNNQEFLDLASLVAVTNHYCTAEPYIHTKCDLHVQKIGNNYRAFKRKSITGNWKSNTGSAMLEQMSISKKHRSWIDQISQLFGGLDICAIELLVSQNNKEYIIEVNDSALSLMGDTQEEDRRHIADLVTSKMQTHCRPAGSTSSVSSSLDVTSPSEEKTNSGFGLAGSIVGAPPVPGSYGSSSSLTSGVGSTSSTTAEAICGTADHQQIQRRDSLLSQSSTTSSNAASVGWRQEEPPPVPPTSRLPFQRQGSQSHTGSEDSEDTMKNLRKTFAGIFGDM
ncbi:PREDICTED: synapsin [Ceratosolen solmsi marchali]|uniref:Synapsin n=1 Tax=Ceratosolen solmsi marchali TaxID=326594 RepID=A0AAJ6YC49_9HYME|nr:PREDICTED: synapsin [Ceratosolen solmsi marchali]